MPELIENYGVETMPVAQAFYEGFTDENGNESKDWNLAFEHARFSHTNESACEFIFYIAEDYDLEKYKEAGFSDLFMKTCEHARARGFDYICLYQ